MCSVRTRHALSARIAQQSRPDEPSQEVPQVVELAMLLILDVDDAPSVLATANRSTIDNDISFRANDSEWDHVLSVPIGQKGPRPK